MHVAGYQLVDIAECSAGCRCLRVEIDTEQDAADDLESHAQHFLRHVDGSSNRCLLCPTVQHPRRCAVDLSRHHANPFAVKRGLNQAALGVASYVVTTAVLVVALLFVLRRRATPGTATATLGAVALFELGTHEFPGALTIAALAALMAAAVVDLLLVRLDRIRGTDAPLRLPIAGALLPALIWPAQFVALDLAAGVHWPAELIGGSVVVSVGVGALLGGLAARPAPVTVNT